MEAPPGWIRPELVLIGVGNAAEAGTELGETDGVTKDNTQQFFSP